MRLLLDKQLRHSNQFHQEAFEKQDMLKYGYPVNYQKCKNHRSANIICKSINQTIDIKNRKVVCECCGRIVGNDPSKQLFYDNNIFAKYGPGIPLYFQFFKYIAYLMVIYMILFGIYGTISNLVSNDCKKYKHCFSDTLGMRISFLNSYQEENITLIQLILIVLIVVFQTFAFLFVRYKMRQQKQKFDEILTSPSDFSIILRQLPKGTTQRHIQETVNEFRGYLTEQEKNETNNLKIHKIIFAHNLKECLKIQKQNIENFKKSFRQNTIFHKIPQPLIEQKLTTAVVIFQKELSKTFFLGYVSCIDQLKRSHWLGYQPLSTIVQVNGQYVNSQRAPQPDDIIWENEGITVKELLIRRTVVYIFNFGMLIVSAVFQYGLAQWRMTFNYQDLMVQRLFSLGLACFITIINYLITMVLMISCKFEKPRTHTLLRISMTFKLVLMQFINSGLISIVITAAIYLPDFRFYKTVVLNDMLFIMVMNVVVNNAVNFLMVTTELPSWLDRLYLHFRMNEYTQAEANKIFQANDIDIEYKYAYIFKTLWLTAFFMPSQPCVILLSIAALAINYWSQKYLFSGYYSIPYMFSSRISLSVLDLLNYTSLWLVLGSFFIHLLRLNFHIRLMPFNYIIWHIIGLILSLFVIYAPLSSISKKIFGDYVTESISFKSYEIEQQSFEVTYEGSNPAYKKHRPFRGKFDEIGLKLAEAFVYSPQGNVI